MENKLQQLTDKLYNEGLSKGRQQADELIKQANQKAAQIIADANAQAAKIEEDARKAAAELAKNTHNEVRMASQQMVSALRQQIEQMVTMQAITPKISDAWKDGKFLKELITSAVKSWNPSQNNAIEVVLPAAKESAMIAEIKAEIASNFAKGVEISTDSRVKVPFRIAPKGAGYYISFTDADFDVLFKAYVRPRVVELLYTKGE